ncbi:alkylhydroperoxidase AhpD family core domain-containing protein [Flaviramulus basaltis]|uniref:Alkylhydroperoxidase AhpD family core domain-containing protein n=1 Tax=Flaviramulus basaltis TaxID=369401 RepID=A0A1K2ICQ2_9FLAO|nr:carboxymuconolactone decarboxylase family protein [Flaviramulus basaltis]SFZ89491.1 alkylhydroperoxidase AhpD family core domain-containing protein [Flaviramulus basaltis]
MERITFGQIPKGMVERLMAIENYINESTLDLQLLELMRLRVAQINKCAYCIDMHYKELKHTGETELRMSTLSVWNETSFFTEKEKAVLLFTEALTEISKKEVSAEIFKSLTKFFTTEEICNLTFAISQLNTWTRLVRTFKFTAGNYQVNE